jgi:DNA polymerase I-like protein with 3'-5' exonuclease and polymerase domains
MTAVLATLHIADLYHDPRMRLATKADYSKVPRILSGEWPEEPPPLELYRPWKLTQFHNWCASLDPDSHLCIDTEYNSDTLALSLLGLATTDPTTAPTGWQFWWPPQDDHSLLCDQLRILVRYHPVVYQNAVADLPVLAQNCAITYEDHRRIDDTMLMHAVLWSEWPHDLGFLASIYSPYAKTKHLSKQDLVRYNAGDVLDTLAVFDVLRGELAKDPLSAQVYERQSLALIPHILRARKHGIRTNRTHAFDASLQYQDHKNASIQMSWAYAGWSLNPGSTDHLKLQLYKAEGLPVQKHKKTKQPTLDDDAVAALLNHLSHPLDPDEEPTPATALRRIEEGSHPLLEARVVYAAAQQAQSHYVDPCLKADRIYPQIHIHAQASGRWSIIEPPLQQFPKPLAEQLLEPDDDECWIGWDWSNIETWLLAVEAGDGPLLEAMRCGYDTHTLNWCDLVGWSYPPTKTKALHTDVASMDWRSLHSWEGEDDLRRRFAKTFVYRTHYRGDPRRAGDIPGAKKLAFTPAKLQQASQRYLAAHPAIRHYWDATDRLVRATGETRTWTGRRRRLLGKGDALLREGTNHRMQGGVADILNLTVVAILNDLPMARLVYTVHDSAWIALPLSALDGAVRAYARIRQHVLTPHRIEGRDIVFPASFKSRPEGILAK